MSSERFQNALHGVPQAVPPVWLMRQAGRYHSHYQQLRAEHSFMELCREPELAAEVARGPVAEFDFDLAILFSDLLFPLQALGLDLTYPDSGPHLEPKLDRSLFGKLRSTDDALPHLEFQREAMRLTREAIPAGKSLIGFVGGPWTLYVYAVEGSHQGSLRKSKSDPALYHEFAALLVPLLIENIRLQLEGGAEAVMIMDTAAGEVAPDWFQRECLPYLVRLGTSFPGRVGYYSKGSQPAHLRDPRLEASPFAGIGVDWRWNMEEALSMFNRGGFVQGNFDPTLMFLKGNDFERELKLWLEPMTRLSTEQRRGWVCGLGHGVLPQTPEANVRRFVEIVRETFS